MERAKNVKTKQKMTYITYISILGKTEAEYSSLF